MSLTLIYKDGKTETYPDAYGWKRGENGWIRLYDFHDRCITYKLVPDLCEIQMQETRVIVNPIEEAE